MSGMSGTTSASRSRLLMFPVEISSSFAGRPEEMRVHEVGVLGDHHPLLPVGHVVDLLVGRPVRVGQVERVDGVAPRGGQPSGHPPRQLRIHRGSSWAHRLEAAGPGSRAANARTASRSSRSRSS